MKPNMKYALAAIAIAGIAAVGVASAHGIVGIGGWKAVHENCHDEMTVGECRATIESAQQAAWIERCSETYEPSFCEDLMVLQTGQQVELRALYDEYGVTAPTPFAFKGHGHGFPPERSHEACADDMTLAACRDARQAAFEAARLEACIDAYGEEFCQAKFDLQAEHQAERQALFDEYGVDAPAFGPGFPGGPRGQGPHHHPGLRHL